MDLFLPYSLFFLQNVFVFAGSWFVFLLIVKRLNWPVMANFLMYCLIVSAVILLPQKILGMFGALRFSALWMVHLMIFLGAFLIVKQQGKLSWPYLDLAKMRISKREIFLTLIFFLPLAILVLIRFINALYQIPAEYDNLAYHLPFAVEWLRTGDLMQLYYSAFAGPISYYPSNFELLDLYVMLPFKGDLLVNLLNFPLLILTGVAFAAVLSLFKIKRDLVLAITALFLTTPVVLRQVGVPLVDLYFTFTFLAALYFLIFYLQSRERVLLYPMAFSIGLFIGTKYLGLVYGAVLFVVAAGAFLYFSRGRFFHRENQVSPTAIKVILLILLGGGFWYIRNWFDVGNPLYPAGVELFGKNILTGYAPINDNLNSFSLAYNLASWSMWQDFFTKFTSMLAFNSYLFIFAFLLVAAKLVKQVWQKSKENFLISGGLLLAMLIYFLLYLKSPYSYNNLIPNIRYALMFVCFAFAALAYSLNPLKKIWREFMLIILWILMALGLYFYVYLTPEFILNNDRILFDVEQFRNDPFLIAFTLVTVVIAASIFLMAKRQWLSWMMVFFLSFALLNSSHTLREDPTIYAALQQKWYGDYPAWRNLLKAADWFEENNLPQAKIAYTGFNFHYPFFGRKLSREVDYININDCTDCRYGDFARQGLTIRTAPNYAKWLYNLKKLGKEYVIVEPKITDNVENYEFAWMTEHTEAFSSVFQQGSTYIFKVL